MSKCIKCGRTGYLKLSLCREHWHEYYQVELPFNRIKELNVRKVVHHHVLSFWQNHTFIFNKKLPGTTYLPDMRFTNGGGRLIIMEVDEYAHRRYKNEKDRMLEIVGACGSNVSIIRINVDAYKDREGVQHPAIWRKETRAIDEKIVSNVICNEEEWERRKQIILNVVDMSMDPHFCLPFVYLFY